MLDRWSAEASCSNAGVSVLKGRFSQTLVNRGEIAFLVLKLDFKFFSFTLNTMFWFFINLFEIWLRFSFKFAASDMLKKTWF